MLIYHPATHQIVLNPAVMTKDHYENYPVFSPDGRTLYFVLYGMGHPGTL